MEPVTLAVVSLAVLMLLLSFGVPIVFCFSGALAFMSIVGGVTMKGMMMWGLQQILSPTLLCIPLFILAGNIMAQGITQKLIAAANVPLGRVRGSLRYGAFLCALRRHFWFRSGNSCRCGRHDGAGHEGERL